MTTTETNWLETFTAGNFIIAGWGPDLDIGEVKEVASDFSEMEVVWATAGKERYFSDAEPELFNSSNAEVCWEVFNNQQAAQELGQERHARYLEMMIGE